MLDKKYMPGENGKKYIFLLKAANISNKILTCFRHRLTTFATSRSSVSRQTSNKHESIFCCDAGSKTVYSSLVIWIKTQISLIHLQLVDSSIFETVLLHLASEGVLYNSEVFLCQVR